MVSKNLFLAITGMAVATLIVTMTLQQGYAPRDCGGRVAFKKLTHEFEKNVITAIYLGNPDTVDEDLDTFVLFMRSLFPEEGVMRIFSAPLPDDG